MCIRSAQNILYMYWLDTDTFESIRNWYSFYGWEIENELKKKKIEYSNLRIYFCKSMGQKRLKTKKTFFHSIFKRNRCQGTRNESIVSMERKKGSKAGKMQKKYIQLAIYKWNLV